MPTDRTPTPEETVEAVTIALSIEANRATYLGVTLTHLLALQEATAVDRDSVRAVLEAIKAEVKVWRANADMLAECNKGEYANDGAMMQRACADAITRILHPKEKTDA